MSRKALAVQLSRLARFATPDAQGEQYATEGDVAADLLWDAYMRGLLDGSVVDLGAGTGILGIGAALLGAEVTLVERDPEAFAILEENVRALGIEVTRLQMDVKEYATQADLVIMNPPFGTRETHADRDFLSVAFRCAPVVYSFHKSTTASFIRAFARDMGFAILDALPVDFALPRTMEHHTKRRARISVTRYLFARDAAVASAGSAGGPRNRG